MTLRVVSIMCLMVMITGCGGPPEVRVASTEVRFRTYTVDVLTFDAEIRKGDSLCWQHGDDGTGMSSTWKTDKVMVLTISKSADRLDIVASNGTDSRVGETMSTESFTLRENPELKNGRYHVGNYVKKFGVVEIPLYVYVKKGE